MDGFENKKQKLAKAILKKDLNLYKSDDDIQLTDEEKETFLRRVFNGQIGRADFVRVVDSLPVGDVEAIYEKNKDNKYKMRIIAYMTGLGFDNYEKVNLQSMKDFIKKYPSPVEFGAAEIDFLNAVRESNPEQKYDDYKREMEELVDEIYGEKEEVLDLYREIVKDAEEWHIEKESVRLTAEFIPGAEIVGDKWMQNGQEYMLTTEILQKVGLGPRFYLEMGGAEIALSRVFKVDTHEAAIAYVRLNGIVKVRGYYRSNSQAMWRLLPDYVGGNGEIAWYGVGFNEESLNLPMKIQKELNLISNRGIWEIPGVNTGFFLGGTAKHYESKEEYKKLVEENKMDSDYYKEMEHEPKLNFGVLSPEKHPPFSVDIDDENGPNYRMLLDHYTMKTEMYGEITVRQFPSFNDELRYLICEVGKKEEKKAWIGTIEVNAPMTSVGLTKGWVSSGDICTPLYEYQSMSGGYGVNTGRTDGYVSMWEKYLSQMPIIKKYLYTWGNVA